MTRQSLILSMSSFSQIRMGFQERPHGVSHCDNEAPMQLPVETLTIDITLMCIAGKYNLLLLQVPIVLLQRPYFQITNIYEKLSQVEDFRKMSFKKGQNGSNMTLILILCNKAVSTVKNDLQSNIRGSSLITYIYVYIKGSLILTNTYHQASKHHQKRCFRSC